MTWLRNFHVALTFLTRLGRARITSSAEINASISMYPLVGGVIGLGLALVAMTPVSPWVLAWGLTGANIFLTRGLHWDGWADLWDGWGSGVTGERFWEIVKDSRIGAFGVLGLVLGLGLQTALFETVIRQQAWATLVWSCVFGRFCCLVLAFRGRSMSRPGLGRNALRGATGRALLLGGLCTVMPGLLLSPSHIGLSLIVSLAPMAALLRLGRVQGAINGDFLGAAIIAGEICALLPLAIQSL